MYEYISNLHIHSHYSDGSGSIEHIAKCAEKAKIDIVVVTDHQTLKGMHRGKEGYYDQVLVLIGSEENTSHNHYLSMNITKEITSNTDNPQEVINQVIDQGGIGFIAHPFEKGSPLFFKGKAYRWIDWNVKGYTGICVWNYCSQWRDGATSIPRVLYSTFINPNMKIDGPCSEALEKIDQIGQERHIVLVGGSDAHAVKVGRGPFIKEVFPYDFLFKTVNTHILTEESLSGDLELDKKNVYEALEKGSCFIGFDFYYATKGFRMNIKNEKSALRGMGSTVKYQEPLWIEATVPRKGLIKLFQNGRMIKETWGEYLEVPVTEVGVYRIEVYNDIKGKLKPWIFSNPIFVR